MVRSGNGKQLANLTRLHSSWITELEDGDFPVRKLLVYQRVIHFVNLKSPVMASRLFYVVSCLLFSARVSTELVQMSLSVYSSERGRSTDS